jgi:hypothetical protein
MQAAARPARRYRCAAVYDGGHDDRRRQRAALGRAVTMADGRFSPLWPRGLGTCPQCQSKFPRRINMAVANDFNARNPMVQPPNRRCESILSVSYCDRSGVVV